MRIIILLIIMTMLAIFLDCSSYANPMTGSGSETGPAFPRSASILPLAEKNMWTYSLTAYDSLGKKDNVKSGLYHLSIPKGYAVQNDSQLIDYTWENRTINFPAYAFRYEWEQSGEGVLVVYRGLYDMSSRGLYIIGDYSGKDMHVYKKEKLWFAYPADSGRTWVYNSDTSNTDSSKMSVMQVISTHAPFMVPNEFSISAGTSYNCYLYKETNGSSMSFYYYHPDLGCVGYQNWVDGVLRKTFILKMFTKG